jgi:hypothetical protein
MIAKKWIFLAGTLFAVPVMAKKALIDELTGQNYGTAGCGLGSVVFGDKPGPVQVFAVTTNDIMSNQTFGISSGTLNCGDTPGDKTAYQESLNRYVVANKAQLANHIAQGSGESISALETLSHCSPEANLASSLKAQYGDIFSQDERISDKLYQVISHNPHCSV